ncbi:MAG: YbbC/YhhH family protein [Acidobacteriia bacterium]|nr:YbbC/YhhH family protein [Terriglobia bacterium]
MKTRVILACTVLLASELVGQGYKPTSGYVPDSRTAVRIAEAVLIPVYGERQIEAERPFTASLKNGIWTVTGTLRCPDGKGGTTTSCDGGVAEVRISKNDAQIIYMLHGK